MTFYYDSVQTGRTLRAKGCAIPVTRGLKALTEAAPGNVGCSVPPPPRLCIGLRNLEGRSCRYIPAPLRIPLRLLSSSAADPSVLALRSSKLSWKNPAEANGPLLCLRSAVLDSHRNTTSSLDRRRLSRIPLKALALPRSGRTGTRHTELVASVF